MTVRHVARGSGSKSHNYDLQIIVPRYIRAIWCKDCEKTSLNKDICEYCGSNNIYRTLQKKDPEGYILNGNWNRKGRTKDG